MIHEFRTYTVRVGGMPEVLKRYEEAYDTRKDIKPITAFWITEIGPLNQIIQVWSWQDMAERERIRAELSKLATWPPGLGENVVHQEVELYNEWPFVETLKPGNYGPVYEMRTYTLRPGKMRGIRASWEEAVPARQKISPAVALLTTDMGALNKFVHIWPYPSLEARQKARDEAAATGVWPPKGGADAYIRQENKFMRPASFSPMQ